MNNQLTGVTSSLTGFPNICTDLSSVCFNIFMSNFVVGVFLWSEVEQAVSLYCPLVQR